MANNFLSCLDFLLTAEGGYSNNPKDRGGATNMGVTHFAYDAYRKKHNLPTRDVRMITREEMLDIYYNEYYVNSGANKIKDPKLAVLVFDTAVNSGSGTARNLLRKSNGDVNKYIQLRLNNYKEDVKNHPEQKEFIKGWINRINNISKYLNETMPSRDFYHLNTSYKKYMDISDDNSSKMFDYLMKLSKKENFYKDNLPYSNSYNNISIEDIIKNNYSNSKYFIDDNKNGHWVTINGNHVFLENK